MKIVKYVFLLLVLAVIAVTVFIATQEGKYNIKKERIIKVPKAVLYNYINDYKNWENVGILTEGDTTTVFTYSDNSIGEGAQMTWKKDGADGKIQTVKLAENDSIRQNAVIDNLNSELLWRFKDTLNSTKVTVILKGQLSFAEKANALLHGGVSDKTESVLEKGLDNLNSFLVHELTIYNIKVNEELVTKTGAFYLGHSATTKITDINKKAGEIFPKLHSFIKTNKIVTNGSPFILYKKFDKEAGNATYLVCIPIKEEIFTTPGSEFEGGEVLPFTALKTTLKGDYSHLPKAWKAANKYIAEKPLQENTTGQYIELYSKGVPKTKKPSEWVTDIYIPIGQPTVAPVTGTIPSPVVPNTTSTRPTATVPVKPTNTTVPSTNTNKPAAGTTPKPATGTAKSGTTTTAKPATTKPVTTPVKKPTTQPTTTP